MNKLPIAEEIRKWIDKVYKQGWKNARCYSNDVPPLDAINSKALSQILTLTKIRLPEKKKMVCNCDYLNTDCNCLERARTYNSIIDDVAKLNEGRIREGI